MNCFKSLLLIFVQPKGLPGGSYFSVNTTDIFGKFNEQFFVYQALNDGTAKSEMRNNLFFGNFLQPIVRKMPIQFSIQIPLFLGTSDKRIQICRQIVEANKYFSFGLVFFFQILRL